ncbi:RES family NAD+ phosphorylase [Xanthomonas translucens]|uniref:RES family NAD+ phosphorylase n=1 Tax=Xanthomonas campestris pv. translucens TaxID=343 RepID=UPI0009C19231|nr:RES family NAD+ phosphorylase [Xanthomonas translucens]
MKSPGAAENFNLSVLDDEDPEVWYHVYATHSHSNTALTFSQGWGDTRFAPINLPDGSAAHTYYVASTARAAIMESVFHDVPLSPPGELSVSSLTGYHLVQLRLVNPLRYVSFHTPFLPALGLTRTELIESIPALYGETRPWAEAALMQRPEAQAIGYGSRLHDSSRCLMLVKQRLLDPPFQVLSDDCLAVEPLRRKVLDFARQLGISETP